MLASAPTFLLVLFATYLAFWVTKNLKDDHARDLLNEHRDVAEQDSVPKEVELQNVKKAVP